MPAERNKKSGSSKKKKRGFLSRYTAGSRGFVRDFAKGAEDAATGFPTGVVAIAHALDQAMPKSPIPGVDNNHVRDTDPILRIGKGIAQQTAQDLRHPLRDPFSTFLTGVGVATLGTGSAARVGSGISKAAKVSGTAKKTKEFAKGATRPRPKTRKVTTIRRPNKYKTENRGGSKQTVLEKSGRPVDLEVEANPNMLVRGARKVTLDPLYRRSKAKAEADIDNPKAGRYARMVERRTLDERKRRADALRSVRNPIDEVPSDNLVQNVFRSPMDLMRLSMYLRPRYYVQNLGGTAQLMAHAGVSLGDVKAVRNIAKNDPELYQLMKAAGGESLTNTTSVGAGGGRLGRTSRKAADIANRPEANMRTVGVWKAAKDYGLDDPAALKQALRRPDSDEAQLIMQRANEMLVDYGRIGGSGTVGQAEKAFVRSGLPIFYPMMKGFTRYGTRFPTQHPFQTAAINYVGQQGKQIQRENLGGEPQPWFPYITPTDDFGTLNLQNMSTFSPATDIFRQAAQAAPGAQRHPTLNLLQALGPSAELVYGALTGRQVATGFEYDADTLDQYGSFLTALGDTAKSVVPGLDYLSPRSSAAYGEPTRLDQLMLALVGPGLYSRDTDYSKVKQPKKKKAGRKKQRDSGF